MDYTKLSQRAMSDVFGIAPSGVQKREAKGMPRNDDGSYSAPECILWCIAEARDTQPKLTGEDADEMAVQELRWKKARADKVTLEAAEKAGMLCKTEDVDRQVIGAFTTFSICLHAIPSAMAIKLQGCDEEEIEAELTLALKGAMRQMKAVYASSKDEEQEEAV